MARRMMSLNTIPLSYGKCVTNCERNLINKIHLLSRDEKMELLWQLNCAYTKIYNMECSTTKEDCIQSDAICELAKIHNIVKKSLQ